jgi:23S rRNA (uracil1939-C5)-methyltransferase
MTQQNADNRKIGKDNMDSNADTTSDSQDSLEIWQGQILSVSTDGMGVGTLEVTEKRKTFKRPIFVPFTTPEDIVRCTVDMQHGKYLHGTLKQIITPSRFRAIPTCPHFTQCGGCNMQHIEYNAQLESKSQQINFLLQRKEITLPCKIQTLNSISRVNYRARSKIAISFDEKITAGYRKYHAHDIIAITHCDIVKPQILEFIKLLNSSEPQANRKRFACELEVHVAIGVEEKLGVYVDLDQVEDSFKHPIRDFFERIYAAHRTLIGNLSYKMDSELKVGGQVQEHLSYNVQGIKFAFSPDIFIQANIATNELLVQKVIDFIKKDNKDSAGTNESNIIDLYSGIGNFSLPIAKHAKHVTGVEGNERSVEFARFNALQNDIQNVTFVNLPIEQYLHTLYTHAKSSSHVVIDPPRTGCTPDVLYALLGCQIKSIIYISCDPTTLANDLHVLQEGYYIDDIVAVDMFPNISHVETIVLLKKLVK